jgi:DNA topoisomerase-1
VRLRSSTSRPLRYRSHIAVCNARATGSPPTARADGGQRLYGSGVATIADAPPVTESDGRASARAAGLRYSTDAKPGITRKRAGRGFSYRRPDRDLVHDAALLARIRALAIPPAWTDVWICPDPAGHLQATGRDARGRKQYRYHERWRTGRDDAKFERLIDFARVLPRIRKRCDADLATPGLSREKVLAAVVRFLETTLIRVGNDEYARLNRSFGLTTLKRRHATVTGAKVRFRFRGKSGRQHEVGIRDRRLAAVVRRCQDLPGQELFQYVGDDGEPHDVASDDVNDYLREISGIDITAKDFRTWAGTVLAYRALRALAPGTDDRSSRRNVVEAVRFTSDRLGNTPAVARRSYVHPAILEAYMDGSIGGALLEAAEEQADPPSAADPREERQVVALLRKRLADEQKSRKRQRTGGTVRERRASATNSRRPG